MKRTVFMLFVLAATVAAAQQQPLLPTIQGGEATATPTLGGAPSVAVGRIGDDDLLEVTVYDSSPLTGPVRVSQEGNIRLPMVIQPIHAAGLYPRALEKVIAATLIKDHLLLNPIVTVTIIEYDSRPITVVGAVRSPLTFQAMGPVTLLDAISRAKGLTAHAGSEVLVSSHEPGANGKEATLIRRIPVSGLLDSANPALNIDLHGGDVVRVPEAGRIYVVGDVKKPGYYFITGSSQSSIMKALALSGGLGRRSGRVAYIYRREGGAVGRNEIPVPLKKIMRRKSPDVALQANDILYVPGKMGGPMSPVILQDTVSAATAIGATLLYVYH